MTADFAGRAEKRSIPRRQKYMKPKRLRSMYFRIVLCCLAARKFQKQNPGGRRRS
jgi:hypothetical protein